MNNFTNPNAPIPDLRWMHFYPGEEWHCQVCGTKKRSLMMITMRIGICEACATIVQRLIIKRGGFYWNPQGDVLSGVMNN